MPWFASRCLDRRLSTWQMTAVLFLTARNAHCGQRTFRLAWCHEHSAATVTELLQPQDPGLWNSLPVQLRNPDIIYGLFRRQLKAHLFRGSMNTMALCDFDMRRLKRTLTYLLTRHWQPMKLLQERWCMRPGRSTTEKSSSGVCNKSSLNMATYLKHVSTLLPYAIFATLLALSDHLRDFLRLPAQENMKPLLRCEHGME